MGTLSVFENANSLGGVLSADSVILTFPSLRSSLGESLPGLVMQQVGINWGRPVQMVYSLGSRSYYYVLGRPAGDATMSFITGPSAAMNYFYEQFGNACNAEANQIELRAEQICGNYDNRSTTHTGCKITLKSAILTSTSVTAQVNDGMLNSSVQMLIGGLLLTDAA